MFCWIWGWGKEDWIFLEYFKENIFFYIFDNMNMFNI